jgi:hypothetical protein
VAPIDPATLERARSGDRAAVDQVLATIVDGAKDARKPIPRWLWIVAGAVAAICLAMFVIVLVGDAGPATPKPPREITEGSFATGLAIGLGVGIVLGWTIARLKSRA